MIINNVEIAGQALASIATILFIVAEATSYWLVLGNNALEGHIGFWEYCLGVGETEECEKVEFTRYYRYDIYGQQVELVNYNSVIYTKYIFISCDIFLVFALICLLVSFGVKHRGSAVMGEGSLLLICGFNGMVGCCITSITSDNFRYIEADISLGYSLYLGWVSTVFFFICGSLLINAGQRYKKQTQTQQAAPPVPVIVYVDRAGVPGPNQYQVQGPGGNQFQVVTQ